MTQRAPENLGKALTLQEAAERLQVNERTLRRWINTGEGPRCFRGPARGRGHVLRFFEAHLVDWIERYSTGGPRV